MISLKRFGSMFLMLVLLVNLSTGVIQAQSESEGETEQALIQIVAASDTFVDWLAGYPDWIGHAYKGDDGSNTWYVEFYNSDESDWLGYANINADDGEIYDAFAPVPLPTDVYQEQQPRIQALVLDDPEVMTRLGDFAAWDAYTDYNRYESLWDVYLVRGIDAILVKARLDESDNFYIDSIVDPNALSEEQTEQAARDKAIGLAYSGEGLDQALEGHDDWITYVENQGDPRWSVAFEADGEQLFYALVDIATDKVLEVIIREGE
jgi:hypothetical protein